MRRFTSTLVAEGSSDQALVPFIEFVLDEHCRIPHVTTFASDLPSGSSLHDRVTRAMTLYPCDLLFVHRDADRAPVSQREDEIRAAVQMVGVPAICLIPVRMTEAWLLIDEMAIRRASGNTSGKTSLGIPTIAKLEANADPKGLLFAALERASELGPNRLRRFDRYQARRQVSGFMEEPAALRKLPSFVHFESQVRDFFLETRP